MNYKAMVIVAVLAACGGEAPGAAPDSGTPPAEATVPTAGTYKPSASATALTAAPAGPAMDLTMITDWSGAFSMVLPNYDFVLGGMAVYPDGRLWTSNGMTLAHQDGGVEIAKIVGTSVGGSISGTVNGTIPFSVALTTIQDQAFTIAQMAGNYLSTSTSTGAWVAISIVDNQQAGNIQGYAYASQADAQAANTAKAVGHYLGTISHTGTRSPDGGVPANAFDIGFALEELPNGPRHPATSGFAYFTTSGLVVLTVQPATGEQFTATFAKQ